MTESIENMFEEYTLMENPNWKGVFKNGQFYIAKQSPELKGYIIAGFNTERKSRIISRFMLSEDVNKCNIIESSELLDEIVNNLKGK